MIDIKAIREAAESTPNPWPMSLQPNTVLALCDEIERLRNASRTETTSVDIEGLREMAQQMEARVGSADDAAFSARVVLALISVVDELTEIANQTRQTCYGLTNSLRGSSDEIERLRFANRDLSDWFEAATADAARYEWFRKGNRLTVKCKGATVMFGPNTERDYPEQLDAAIDAAMESK